METQLKKGILEIFVLGVLKRGDSYGYKIVQDLAGVIAISESTLYPILRRLEQARCLTTYQVEYQGRLRRYYRISELGKQRVMDFIKEWEDVKNVYDFILSEGDENHG